MTRPERTGNGDICEQDEAHGRMWMLATGKQYCPHADHRPPSVYLNDGVTPASRSSVAAASSPRRSSRTLA